MLPGSMTHWQKLPGRYAPPLGAPSLKVPVAPVSCCVPLQYGCADAAAAAAARAAAGAAGTGAHAGQRSVKFPGCAELEGELAQARAAGGARSA